MRAGELGDAADSRTTTTDLDWLEQACADAARIVADELRPAFDAVAGHRRPPEELVALARACGTHLSDARIDVGTAPVQPSMGEPALRVERALAIYVQAASSLEAAAAADGDRRIALLNDVAAFLGFADWLHGTALASLAALRP